MADDDLVVEIAGEETGADETTGGTAAAVAEAEAQFKALQADVARERDEKSAALRSAAQARDDAAQAARERDAVAKELTDTRASTVDDGISAANDAIAAAKKEIQTASEAGEHAKAAEAYATLARATARLERLSEAKADIEVQRTEPARGRVVEAPAQRHAAADDPVERMVAGMSQRSADWLRSHREYVTDDKKNAKIRAAHFDAVGEGHTVDSEAYFEHLEKYVGLRQADDGGQQRQNGAQNGAHVDVVVNGGNGAAQPKPAPKPAARRAPVAPVQPSGGSSLGAGSGGGTVRLSKKQAEAAQDGTHVWNYDDPSPQKRFRKGEPIGLNEMARRVKALTDQGLFRPENSELS